MFKTIVQLVRWLIGVVFGTNISVPELAGRVFVITGGNSGVGYVACRVIYEHGGHVIMAGRSKERCQRAVEKIKEEVGSSTGKIEYMIVDLMSFRSIAKFAEDFKAKGLPLRCLVNNAGIGTPPSPDLKSEEGFDPTMATNYLGAAYLTHLLLERLQREAPSRCVIEGSVAEAHGSLDTRDFTGQKGKNQGYPAYARSKMAIFMMVAELQRRVGRDGVDFFVCHPGISKTAIFSKSDRKASYAARFLKFCSAIFGQSAEWGAVSLIRCCTDPCLTGFGGGNRHYGPYYRLLLPFRWVGMLGLMTTNFLNSTSWQPQNPLIRDREACEKLYRETIGIINDTAERMGTPKVQPARSLKEQ